MKPNNLNKSNDADAWFYNLINSDDFWKVAERTDNDNQNNHFYGKHIVIGDSELNSFFENIDSDKEQG